MIEKVCVPLIHGQDAASVAAANGLKKTRDGWVLLLEGVQRISVFGPTVANPTICTLTVNYDLDQTKPFLDALGNWAAAQNPPLPPFQTAVDNGPGATGWSWYVDAGAFHKGVVFTAQKKPDGKPMGRTYEVATVRFSLKES